MQSETEQRPHKVSFYVEKAKAEEVMKALSGCLEKCGVSLNFFQCTAFVSVLYGEDRVS